MKTSDASAGKYEDGRSRPVRVLFLAWGYSIHAVRRIRIFLEDPGFEVAVVSNHDYRFPGALNILLTDEEGKKKIREEIRSERERLGGSAPPGRRPGLFSRVRSRFRASTLLIPFLHRIGIHDLSVIRSAGNSLDVLEDVAIAGKDRKILLETAARFDPDVVFLQTLLYPCHLAYNLPKKYPIIVTFWNGDAAWWAWWNGIDRVIKRQIVSCGVRRAVALTANSDHVRHALSEVGADERKIHIIRYPGVDLERFAPGPKEPSRRELRITAKKVVFCPRGIGGYLNSDIIIESMPEVLRTHPDTLFLFVSDVGTDIWEKHVERARSLGVGDHLRRDGQVPWERMTEYYRASDAMVSISSNDSLPNCMLEAMACGIPLIMGDIPQIRDWVEDGVNGCMVPCRDPVALAEGIREIFDAPSGRIEEFSLRNRRLVEREADSRKASEQIRDLVRKHAGKT
jgi:glycosyltransferase involved in cell wall biosynthesis